MCVDLTFLPGSSLNNYTVPTSHERQKEMALGLRGDEKHTTPLTEGGRAKKWAMKQKHDVKTEEIQASFSTSQGILLQNTLNSTLITNLVHNVTSGKVIQGTGHLQVLLTKALNMGVLVLNVRGVFFILLERP